MDYRDRLQEVLDSRAPEPDDNRGWELARAIASTNEWDLADEFETMSIEHIIRTNTFDQALEKYNNVLRRQEKRRGQNVLLDSTKG